MKQDGSSGPAVFASDDAERLFLRHLADAAKGTRQSGKPWYSPFLDSRQQQLAVPLLRKQDMPHCFFGGYPGAERAMLCVFEDEGEVDFPISALTIRPFGDAPLTHRDFLGAILALGVDRSGIGDIRTGPEGAIVYLQAHLAPLLRQELSSVGRVNVALEEGDSALTYGEEGTLLRLNVPSLRLDAVLCAALSLSRSDAKALVASGRVAVNHQSVSAPHKELTAGDLLSVRGTGRFKLTEIKGQTRKNRINIEVLKY